MDQTIIDEKAKKIKSDVEGWREVILLVESALTWQRPADPAIVLGSTSFVFFLFWYLDPSFLTTVALVCMAVSIADYTVPMLQTKVFGADSWNPKKEKKLEEICRMIALVFLSLQQHGQCFFGMRTSKPSVFFGITVMFLSIAAWIGNSFNNVFLTYLLAMVMLLIPGLNNKGLLKPIKNILSSMCCKSKETKKID